MDGRTLTQQATRVRVQLNIAYQRFDLYVLNYEWSRGGPYSTLVLNPQVGGWTTLLEGALPAAPSASLSDAEAQELMDDLWRAGIRPTEGKVSDRTLQAQEDHIKSLQAVTKHLLELEKLRI